jgi:hypothetical protein
MDSDFCRRAEGVEASQKTEFRSQNSEVRSQNSEDRSQSPNAELRTANAKTPDRTPQRSYRPRLTQALELAGSVGAVKNGVDVADLRLRWYRNHPGTALVGSDLRADRAPDCDRLGDATQSDLCEKTLLQGSTAPATGRRTANGEL